MKKTPIQILMSEIEDGLKQDEIKVSPKELLQHLTLRCRGLLEEEKEVMCEFAWEYERECRINLERSIEKCWYETFNTKEK